MLSKQINQDIITSIKLGNNTKRDILRIILGEIQNIQARGKKMGDEQIRSLIRKQIQANEELISCGYKDVDRLNKENEILDGYLPKTLSVEAIEAALNELGVVDEIVQAGTGKGTGVAMKALKGAGHSVLGGDVKTVVEKLCS